MLRLLALGCLTLIVAACDSGSTIADGPVDLSRTWTEAEPSEVDLDEASLATAASRMGAIPRSRSLLVVRDGRLAHESYFAGANRETLHDVRSVTKSVVGMLTGIAIEEGHLALDSRLGDLLADADVLMDEDEADITVEDLLTMSGGWEWNETGGSDYGSWITSFDHVAYLFSRPLASTPGTTFRYNSAAVHLLGVVLEEAVEDDLEDFADRALFSPLGIDRAVWEISTGGRVNGGAGLDLQARDLAKLGQLMLQGGLSGDRRVVPARFAEASWEPSFTWRADFDPLSNYTYGQLWWTTDGPPARGALAWGYGGQFIYVAPELDLVVVATTDWRGVSGEPGGANGVEQAVLDVILNSVVPAAR